MKRFQLFLFSRVITKYNEVSVPRELGQDAIFFPAFAADVHFCAPNQ